MQLADERGAGVGRRNPIQTLSWRARRPHVAKVDLWKTSGHYDFYRENMFDQMDIEEEQYQLRPMCAPGP